jgi:hypothetical protein
MTTLPQIVDHLRSNEAGAANDYDLHFAIHVRLFLPRIVCSTLLTSLVSEPRELEAD